MATGGFSTDAESSSTLVEVELVWRAPPKTAPLPNGQHICVGLTRWSNRDNRGTIEVSSSEEDDFHVLSILLRRTKGELYIGHRCVWSSQGHPEEMLLSGPKRGKWRKWVHGGFDYLRVFFPQPLIAECYCAACGREPSDLVSLFEVSAVEDEGLQHLARAFRAVQDYGDIVGPCFADSLGLAFASRLVKLHLGARASSEISGAHSLGKAHIRRVVDYVDEHLARPIYLSDLSKVAGLGRIAFAQQFKAATGLSPYAYVLNQRIVRAQQLLACREATIVGVALDLGFNSQGHFTELFRKLVGVTPGQWRRGLGMR